MSTDTRPGRPRARTRDDADESILPGGITWFRLASLLGVAVLTGAYVSVLYNIARVAGGSGLVVPIVVVTAATAVLLAKYISGRVAAGIGVVLVVVGYAYYLAVTPVTLGLVLERIDRILLDALALLTGLRIIRLIRADVWALAFAPGPVFVSTYLAIRKRYVLSVLVGGGALSFLVLSWDAVPETALVGVLAGIAAVGFGELDRRKGSLLQADTLIVLVAIMTVFGTGASLISASGANPISPSTSGIGGGSTVEGTLVGSTDRVQIAGSISLSAEVRYTVEADEERYWRTGAYDRYTGDGWVRTGQDREYDGSLRRPQGPRRQVVQTYTAESRLNAMPAAAEPVRVVGDAKKLTRVTRQGTLRQEGGFLPNDSYRIYSQVPDANPSMLRSASTDYPDDIEEDYTQLPEDTPDRIGERTANITRPADNPYDTAVLIETYLEQNKDYSLEVERPDGQVADSFLFEMDAGYCTYFATTMVAMLRSQGIPARMAVGYTPGQQVDDDEYVVRGLDSHAWVEVYFPGYGWIKFDPTPAGPRESTELDRVREARESGGGGSVDTDESEDAPLTRTTTTTTTTTTARANTTNGTAVVPRSPTLPGFAQGDADNATANGTVATNGSEGPAGDGALPRLPSPRDTAVGLLMLFAVAAGAHRVGWTDRAYESARMRYQGETASPEAATERAFERLELLLARRYRGRRPGETPREYVDNLAISGLDKRARTVFDTYERAKYAGSVDPEEAEEAVALVDELVAESTPLLGRLRR